MYSTELNYIYNYFSSISPNVSLNRLKLGTCIKSTRWSPKIGQVFKFGSPLMKDGSDDWQTEVLLG